MAPTIALSELEGGLEEYITLMVGTFNHQPSGMAAARRDIALLCGFLRQRGLEQLGADALLQFFSYLRTERDNQPDSLNRKISSIKGYLRYLRFRQVEGAHAFPIESIKRARQPYPGPIEALSLSEVTRLLGRQDQGSVLGIRDFVLFTLLYRLGLRLGEALALDLGDIDLDAEVIHIHGKGRRERTLPLLADLADLIRRWLFVRRRLFRATKTTRCSSPRRVTGCPCARPRRALPRWSPAPGRFISPG
jgi:site-specific recombinase XerD